MKSGSELRSDDHQIEEVVERWTMLNEILILKHIK